MVFLTLTDGLRHSRSELFYLDLIIEFLFADLKTVVSMWKFRRLTAVAVEDMAGLIKPWR
ncbi:hypothetical protein A3197_02315 [Candidatus Thiodiazotropha endoloripes]|nr:hypothetical protein A3197_02315 [Candidatus Thiodiazotropha endoloripes]